MSRIHIDGTWEPGKYLYIEAKDNRRWIRFSDAMAGLGECNLLSRRLESMLPYATITEADVYMLYNGIGYQQIYTFSWITREEAQALFDMAIARNTMEGT